MARIEMYTTAWCGYCHRAKTLLRQKGLAYEEIRVDDQPDFPGAPPGADRRHTYPRS